MTKLSLDYETSSESKTVSVSILEDAVINLWKNHQYNDLYTDYLEEHISQEEFLEDAKKLAIEVKNLHSPRNKDAALGFIALSWVLRSWILKNWGCSLVLIPISWSLPWIHDS